MRCRLPTSARFLPRAALPAPASLGWITLAVLGARTAAMAANRLFDREIDARNPRTARRALASGTLPASTMVWASVAGLALLLLVGLDAQSALREAPAGRGGLLLVYPFCKRFTWLTHFVLGAVDGLAPLGAYVAVAGKITLPALALFAAVTLWVAGFDIIYALMDLPVDRAQGIRSLPERFGEGSGRIVPIVLHLAMLAAAGGRRNARRCRARSTTSACAAVAVLIVYEEYLFRSGANLFVINERVFLSNMTFSVVFLATTLGAYR